MREEEKARREYERAMQQAQREEEIIRQAMERARLEADDTGGAGKVSAQAPGRRQW